MQVIGYSYLKRLIIIIDCYLGYIILNLIQTNSYTHLFTILLYC